MTKNNDHNCRKITLTNLLKQWNQTWQQKCCMREKQKDFHVKTIDKDAITIARAKATFDASDKTLLTLNI